MAKRCENKTVSRLTTDSFASPELLKMGVTPSTCWRRHQFCCTQWKYV